MSLPLCGLRFRGLTGSTSRSGGGRKSGGTCISLLLARYGMTGMRMGSAACIGTELVTKIPSNASRMSRPKKTPVFDCIVEVLAVLPETCTTHVAS